MRLIVVLLFVALPVAAAAQVPLGVALDGAAGAAAFNALAQECYEAGMWSEMPNDAIMDCADPIDDRTRGEEGETIAATIRHKVRFTLIERAGGGRIGVEAWTETEELGTVIEEPVTSEEYLRRVQGVLSAVVARLRSPGTAPWAGR